MGQVGYEGALGKGVENWVELEMGVADWGQAKVKEEGGEETEVVGWGGVVATSGVVSETAEDDLEEVLAMGAES